MAKWHLKGSYFEACNCEVACPCVFLSPPTNTDCTVLLTWHIDDGKYGDVKLDGLNVAMAAYSPGHMQKVKWRAAVYLDSRANQAQTDALGQIFGGKQGGPPAGLAPFIGEVLGVKNVPIQYKIGGKRRSVTIPSVTGLEVEAVLGPAGKETAIENAPFAEPIIYVAKSRNFSYHDHGMNWEISDRNSFYSSYSWEGP